MKRGGDEANREPTGKKMNREEIRVKFHDLLKEGAWTESSGEDFIDRDTETFVSIAESLSVFDRSTNAWGESRRSLTFEFYNEQASVSTILAFWDFYAAEVDPVTPVENLIKRIRNACGIKKLVWIEVMADSAKAQFHVVCHYAAVNVGDETKWDVLDYSPAYRKRKQMAAIEEEERKKREEEEMRKGACDDQIISRYKTSRQLWREKQFYSSVDVSECHDCKKPVVEPYFALWFNIPVVICLKCAEQRVALTNKDDRTYDISVPEYNVIVAAIGRGE